MKRFTHQSAYKDYQDIAGKDSLDFRKFDQVICKFFYRLNRAILVDKYEWKIPYSGGYIRIAKTRHGRFYWKWDIYNPYTRIKKKKMWSFRPAVGWEDNKIGERGLDRLWAELKNNPQVANYDVANIRHYVPKGKKEIIDIEE